MIPKALCVHVWTKGKVIGLAPFGLGWVETTFLLIDCNRC